MEYLQLFGCCCKNDDKTNRITIKCKSNCCRSKSYEINISDDDDIKKILKLLEELERKQIFKVQVK